MKFGLWAPQPFVKQAPGDAYMHCWNGLSLFQVLSEPLLTLFRQLHLGNKIQRNFNVNTNSFFQEDVFPNVISKMAAILLGLQWVKF